MNDLKPADITHLEVLNPAPLQGPYSKTIPKRSFMSFSLEEAKKGVRLFL